MPLADPRERLIVALDHPTAEAAVEQVDALGERVVRYKVGLELFIAAGREILSTLAGRQKRVFLDLKLHDIPETVYRAARAAAAAGVDLLTVHASGGAAMLAQAKAGVLKGALAGARPRLLAVTVLTSLDLPDLQAEGIPFSVEDLVLRRALLAKQMGLDGVVASPGEAAAIRQAVGSEFLIVTPGIRPLDARGDDQKRTATAREARAAGADAVVVGRPIRDAAEPHRVVDELLRELG